MKSMIKEITNQFEKAMKKGFISTLCLIVLNKEPMHGRQIKKVIEERTLKAWDPSDSTIYTILKNLKDKNLIKESEHNDENEKTIIYEITDKGKNALEIMLKKEQEIRESMRSLISSTFGIDNEILKGNFLLHHEGESSIFRKMQINDESLSKSEKIEHLINLKKFIKMRIEMLNNRIQFIEEKISKIEKKSN